jgi:hypothetical protein
MALLQLPLRPDKSGTAGRQVPLQVNHFKVSFPKDGELIHYDVDISPDVSKNIKREVIQWMIKTHVDIFGGHRPVFDGNKNIYAKSPGIVGIGREMTFVVTLPPRDQPQIEQRMVELKLSEEPAAEKGAVGGVPPGAPPGGAWGKRPVKQTAATPPSVRPVPAGIAGDPVAASASVTAKPRRDRSFTVKIQMVNRIPLGTLQDFLNQTTESVIQRESQNGSQRRRLDNPLEAIQALEVVFRQLPSMHSVTVGRNFFKQPKQLLDLSGGRELWWGHYQSLRPTGWKSLQGLAQHGLALNMDISATAFYKPGPVIDYMMETMSDKFQWRQVPKKLRDFEVKMFGKEIKGRKIQVTHRGQIKAKKTVIDLSLTSASQQKFSIEPRNGQKSVTTTVAKYFASQYKPLQYPDLPLLVVGSKEKPTYLPMEVCEIVEGQRCLKKLNEKQTSNMVKMTCKPAPERKAEVERIVREADFSHNPFLNHFNITGGCHNEADTEWIIIRRPLRGHNETPFGRPTPS